MSLQPRKVINSDSKQAYCVFIITPCSIDNENNKYEYYRGKDYMKKNRKDLKKRLRK